MRPLLFALPVAVCAACTTDYQQGADDPRFGSPNALEDEMQPKSGGEVVCVQKGGTLLGEGTCSVSFENDVLPALFRSTCANAGCHGGATPPNPPRVDPAEPAAMWAAFASFEMSAGNLPYINPCSTDKTKSGIACNLQAAGTCGVKMPQGGPQMDQAAIDRIEAWLECGSPNN